MPSLTALRCSIFFFGNSLMVGRLALDQEIGVRVPVPEPIFPRMDTGAPARSHKALSCGFDSHS